MKKTKKNLKTDNTLINNETNEDIMKVLKHYLKQMKSTYKDDNMSCKIYKRLIHSYKESLKINHELIFEDMNMDSLSLRTTTFISPKIIKYIQNHMIYKYTIYFNYKNVDFKINICTENSCDVNKYIMYIKWIICLCLINLQNETREVMNVDFYMTHLKKQVDVPFQYSIQPIHVNSGFTQLNNEMYICIFRKEEWMKVFIHECFHAFNMDFHEEQIHFKNIFKSTFFVESDFLVFESFVEFWARIINCAIFTIQINPSMPSSAFCELFSLNLNIERIHSILQATKLLNLFNLCYEDIINKEKESTCRALYKENTNAFCYYIITSILMNDFDRTIQWFDLNNNDLFQFDKSERQVIIFCYYIKQIANESNFVSLMNELKTHDNNLNPFMKMTLFEININ